MSLTWDGFQAVELIFSWTVKDGDFLYKTDYIICSFVFIFLCKLGGAANRKFDVCGVLSDRGISMAGKTESIFVNTNSFNLKQGKIE